MHASTVFRACTIKLPYYADVLQDDSEECNNPNIIDETTTDDSIMSRVVDVLSSVERTASQSDAVLVSQGSFMFSHLNQFLLYNYVTIVVRYNQFSTAVSLSCKSNYFSSC